MYIREKEKLKQELAKISNRVCLTSDCWTSSTSEGYICLTAQFVDENWRLNCKILNFCRMYPPHTGVEMAAIIYDCLKEWNIEKKVFSITLDNATANDSLQTILKGHLNLQNSLVCDGEFFHVRCSAHILNLIVQEGLKAAIDSLIAIRESVKHVRGSDGRMQKFEQCVKQVGIETNLGLRLDVVTRWNSTYLMLESALPYEKLDSISTQKKISLVKNKLYELFDHYTNKQNVVSASSTIRTTPSEARRKPKGFKVFNEFKAFENETVSSDGKSELDLYLEEPKLDYEKFQDMDVFMYWKDYSKRYPELSIMARDVLSIPITTVSSESSFSIGGRVLTKYRSCIHHENVQTLVATRNWLHGFSQTDENEDVKTTFPQVDSDMLHEVLDTP
ncbi:hypothetical protein KY290_002085 [Solanum tuberosum]|uniref:HAT C-terminal dimerisation domain-containing protein n=1 Tax=Solanum tuberosum TaxID=4113 RepID=A0ABQ7WP13_SOLTU|nr:hypothetical protein KY290_002085 [Solanum tuberosum]